MKTPAITLLSISLLIAACSDDYGGNSDKPTPPPDATPRATISSSATPGVIIPTIDAGAETEVQGIIGAIDTAGGTIEINRLQGADVRTISVSAATTITSARGGSLRLRDLRTSDRIIARGVVVDRALAASTIEISAVVPGGDPGG